jgi:UDP-N-acetylmuramoyl-tripeptide--D-alanyl-D-alanine ligase
MTILLFLVSILALINVCSELKRDLMMLQQNSYRNERYTRWLSTSKDTTSMWRMCGLIILFVSIASLSKTFLPITLIGLFGAIQSYVLFKKKYKKPLAWTARAKRIYATALIVTLLVIAILAVLFGCTLQVLALSLMGGYCASHIILLTANTLLKPIEKSINNKYYREAANILKSMPDLKIIGITGSYGKTSTKYYLQRILSEQFDTLMTPGSFNTTLGVIRTIREYLKPYNEVFIVEMGAKQPNDIKEICDLVHPEIGIITAVGPQHLESFKTIERVQATKFELADALPSNGLAVINDDFEYIKNRKVTNTNCIRYAVHATEGTQAKPIDIEYTPTGTTFTIDFTKGDNITLHTKLVGECNISNLTAAVAVARYLGVSDDKIKYAVERIEQVEHRLSIKRTAGGVTIIDDAFNSNPVGSHMALNVIAGMKTGRRIVVTPGMIELGDDQYKENCEFGKLMAKSCDLAIVVGKYNRDAILEGLHSGKMSEDAIMPVDSFAEAQALLSKTLKAGDIILYENDLPDTFK